MTVHHHCVTLRWWPGDYSLILFSSALQVLTMFDMFIVTHMIFVHCNDGISPSFPPINSPLIPCHPVIVDCLYVAIMVSPATDSAAAVSTSIPCSLATFDLFDNHPFTSGRPHAPSLLCTCGTSCLSSDFIQITHCSLGQAK